MAIKGTKPIKPISDKTANGKKLLNQILNPVYKEPSAMDKEIADVFFRQKKKTA